MATIAEAAAGRYEFDLSGGEELLPIRQAPAAIARIGRRPREPHQNQIHRWHRNGIRGVRLPTVMLGGRRFTSVPAIEWWVTATTAAAEETPEPLTIHAELTSAQRAVLRRAGILEGVRR